MDRYGYISRAVAALQVLAAQIEALQEALKLLRKAKAQRGCMAS